MQEDHATPKPARRFAPAEFVPWVLELLARGHTVHVVYEACGFGLCRALRVARADLDANGKAAPRLAISRPILAVLDTQIATLSAELEAAAPREVPSGLGKLATVTLSREVCDHP